MNAWRVMIGDDNPLQLKRIPIPQPAADGVLVKILAMGVCHTDCFIRDTKEPRPGDPAEFTLGHEGADEIVELGRHVSLEAFALGDKVAIHIIPGCKDCPTCKIGLNRICQSQRRGGYGLGRDGMFQEYAHVRADACVQVPEGVAIEQAAISSDALLTAYHAVKNVAEVKPGQTIAVIGLGGLGLNGLQIAQHLGASRILVVDKRQESVGLATSLGTPSEDAFAREIRMHPPFSRWSKSRAFWWI